MVKRCHTALIASVMIAITALVGCENTTPGAQQRAAIEAAVKGYLDTLAEAYSSMDVSGLEEHATGKEIADIRRLLHTLAASGDRVESTLIGLDVVSMQVFREVNATVTLVEVWDVRRYDAHTGREKGRNPKSVQNSIIQLRFMDGRWMVTARRIQNDEAQSRWKVTTPTPEAEKEPE